MNSMPGNILITNWCRKKYLGQLPSLKKGAERICLLSEAIILVFQQLNSSWCDARWYIPIGALRCSRLHHGPLQSVGWRHDGHNPAQGCPGRLHEHLRVGGEQVGRVWRGLGLRRGPHARRRVHPEDRPREPATGETYCRFAVCVVSWRQCVSEALFILQHTETGDAC